MTTGLIVKGLSASFRGRPDVLSEVSFEASQGALTAIVGPNGSGKSTLLRALLGLLPSTGEVRLGGARLEELTGPERARRMAYVAQRSALSARLSVAQVIAQGRFLHRGPWWRASAEESAAIEQALQDADVAHLAKRSFTELSGGEAQRVMLARALATGAQVLMLDEPTSAQDLRQRLQMQATLRELARRGFMVLVCLHDLDEVERVADQVLLLDQGRVVASGGPRAVLSVARLRGLYGVEVRAERRRTYHLGESTEG